MNVIRWCPFVHLLDSPFQNLPNGHDISLHWNNNRFLLIGESFPRKDSFITVSL